MYTARDRDGKVLQFNGQKLAESSSKRRDSSRWIEFALYKTEGGSYVLARAGVSLVYHSSVCPLVSKYGLHQVHTTDIAFEAVPCEECTPDLSDPYLFPETTRYWTMTSKNPEAVLDALYKEDHSGARYLTNVAQRLLKDAADNDPEIDMVYRVEVIP